MCVVYVCMYVIECVRVCLSVFASWVLQQLIRYSTHCSEVSDFNNLLSEFEVQLAARAYPPEVFTIALSKLPTRDVLLAKLSSRVHQPRFNETTTVTANGSLGPTLFLRLPAVQPGTLTRICRQLSNCPKRITSLENRIW